MLAIRLQRTGRKGHAMFRVVVQDSRRTPTSGKVVAALGSFDPHNKNIIIDKEKADHYLKNGAQPSDRIARLLKSQGVKLPEWVSLASDKKRTIRHPEKRRSTAPKVKPEPTDKDVSKVQAKDKVDINTPKDDENSTKTTVEVEQNSTKEEVKVEDKENEVKKETNTISDK